MLAYASLGQANEGNGACHETSHSCHSTAHRAAYHGLARAGIACTGATLGPRRERERWSTVWGLRRVTSSKGAGVTRQCGCAAPHVAHARASSVNWMPRLRRGSSDGHSRCAGRRAPRRQTSALLLCCSTNMFDRRARCRCGCSPSLEYTSDCESSPVLATSGDACAKHPGRSCTPKVLFNLRRASCGCSNLSVSHLQFHSSPTTAPQHLTCDLHTTAPHTAILDFFSFMLPLHRPARRRC